MRKSRLLCFILFALFIDRVTLAQSSNEIVREYQFFSGAPNSQPVSNPFTDLQASEPTEPGHKSVFLAAALSAAIPGLGEYYVGDKNWWHGLIFTGIEAGMWVGYSHWNHRGDDSMAAFHSFTDTHFSLCRYADSMIVFFKTDSIRAPLPDCNNPASINRAEEILDSLSLTNSDIKDFGHRLTFSDQQQYYELLSKYLQYQRGWDAVANWNRASDMRANMNDQYGTATYFLWGAIANHILSAIDAAILASDHNARLRLHGEIIQKPNSFGSLDIIPTANIEFRF